MSNQDFWGQIDELPMRHGAPVRPLTAVAKLAKVFPMVSLTRRPNLRRHAPAADIRARYPAARIHLIRAREQVRLSRPDLARLLGLSRFFVFSVEVGWRNPRFELMQLWAQALNAPLDIFVSDPLPPLPNPPPAQAA
jgi:DNA-binding XRE family transcriptional regulator